MAQKKSEIEKLNLKNSQKIKNSQKKLNFKKSFSYLGNCKNMNFCAVKVTKNEILGPKKSEIEKLGPKNSQKLKIWAQKFTKMEKLHKFQSSVFYEFGPTVIWFTFFKLKSTISP